MKRSDLVNSLAWGLRHNADTITALILTHPEKFADALIGDLEASVGMTPPLNPVTGKNEWEAEDEKV